MRFSLAGKISMLCAPLLAVAVLGGAWLTREIEIWWLAWLIILLLTLPVVVFGVHWIIRPVEDVINALSDGAESLRDNDFSVSVAKTRNDELGRLVGAHNELGTALREERQSLFQRELLLDTVIQSADLALILTNAGDRVVYSNTAARALFNGGKPVNGHFFSALINEMPAAFSEVLNERRDGLFTLEGDEPKTYHLSASRFSLNAQPHFLYLYKHLTQELSRQEVATWKQVIRLISHELNNSLAPISSLAHSGKTILDRKLDAEKLAAIFTTIEDRARHLKDFIESYARFARLPSPRPQRLSWRRFFENLQTSWEFSLVEPFPDVESEADPGQIEQVMINLVKNAVESGSPIDDVQIAAEVVEKFLVLSVSDKGGGISAEVMRNALLPFYSTKKTGTGLGLPLCREIIEAHGGRLSLSNTAAADGLRIKITLPLTARPAAA